MLKQDESNPITLPLQYSLYVRVFKRYERQQYTSFGTINLIDDFGNITDQYTHSVSWSGDHIMSKHHNQNVVHKSQTYKGKDGPKLATLEWGHVCYSVDFNNNTFKVVVDGKLAFSHTIYTENSTAKYDIKENQRFELILGNYQTQQARMSQRTIGMYHGFNMYNGLLDEQVMENITG